MFSYPRLSLDTEESRQQRLNCGRPFSTLTGPCSARKCSEKIGRDCPLQSGPHDSSPRFLVARLSLGALASGGFYSPRIPRPETGANVTIKEPRV